MAITSVKKIALTLGEPTPETVYNNGNLGPFDAIPTGTFRLRRYGDTQNLPTLACERIIETANKEARISLTSTHNAKGMLGFWVYMADLYLVDQSISFFRLHTASPDNFTLRMYVENVGGNHVLSVISYNAGSYPVVQGVMTFPKNRWVYIQVAWHPTSGQTQYFDYKIHVRAEGGSLNEVYSVTNYRAYATAFDYIGIGLINTSGSLISRGGPTRFYGIELYNIEAITDSGVYPAMAAPAPVTEGTTWYFSENGHDTNNDGTYDYPYKTGTKLRACEQDSTIFNYDTVRLGVAGSPFDATEGLVHGMLEVFTGVRYQLGDVRFLRTITTVWTSVGGNTWTTPTGSTALFSRGILFQGKRILNKVNRSSYDATALSSLQNTVGSYYTDGTNWYIHCYDNLNPNTIEINASVVRGGGTGEPFIKSWIKDAIYETYPGFENYIYGPTAVAAPSNGSLNDSSSALIYVANGSIIRNIKTAFYGKHAFASVGQTAQQTYLYQDCDILSGSPYGTSGQQTALVDYNWSGPKTISAITNTGNIATVTCNTHGFTAGIDVWITGASPAEYSGVKRVLAVTDANTFKYAVVGAPASPATLNSASATPMKFGNVAIYQNVNVIGNTAIVGQDWDAPGTFNILQAIYITHGQAKVFSELMFIDCYLGSGNFSDGLELKMTFLRCTGNIAITVEGSTSGIVYDDVSARAISSITGTYQTRATFPISPKGGWLNSVPATLNYPVQSGDPAYIFYTVTDGAGLVSESVNNHTLTLYSPASPSGATPTNTPENIQGGLYRLRLTAAETTRTPQFSQVLLRGVSSNPRNIINAIALPIVPSTATITVADVLGALTAQGYTSSLAAAIGTTNSRVSGPVALAADLTTVGNNVAAVKAKTDAIPTWPARFSDLAINASGYVTATNSSISIGDVQTALTNQGYTTSLATAIGTTNGRISGNVALAADLTTVGNNVTGIRAKTDTIPTWPVRFSDLAINASGYVTATNASISIADVQTALTNQGYTAALAMNIGTTNGRIAGPVALANDLATVSGNVIAVKGKTDTIPTWPNNFHLLAVNGSGHVTSSNAFITGADVQSAMTAQGYTPTLASQISTTNSRVTGPVALSSTLVSVGNYAAAIKIKTDSIPDWPNNFPTLAINGDGQVTASNAFITGSDVQNALTAQGYTSTLAAQIGTTNSRVTGPVALTAALTAVANNVVSVKEKTDALPAWPARLNSLAIDTDGRVVASNVVADSQTALTAQGYTSGLASDLGTTNTRVTGPVALGSALTAVGNNITAVKAKTDAIPNWPARFSDLVIDTSGRVTASNTFLTGADVQSAMTAQGYTASLASGLATTNSRVTGPAALASDLTAVANNVIGVKAKTDTIPAWPARFNQLVIDTSGRVTASNTFLTGADVQSAMTSQGYTTELAGQIGTTNSRVQGAVALASSLTTIGNNVAAVKVKTDSIPSWPNNFHLLAINGSGFITATNSSLSIDDVRTAMTNQGYTTGLASGLATTNSRVQGSVALSATLSAVAADLSAVKSKTDALPAWPANLDKLAVDGDGRVTAGNSFLSVGDVQTAMTNQGFTPTVAGRLDVELSKLATASALNSVASNVASVKTKTDAIPTWPSGFSNLAIGLDGSVNAGNMLTVANVQTAMSNQGFTPTVAGRLNVALSTLATGDSLAAVAGNVAAVRAKTDLIDGWPAGFASLVISGGAVTVSSLGENALADVQAALAAMGYTAQVGAALGGSIAAVDAIKLVTDRIPTFPENFAALEISEAGWVAGNFGNAQIADAAGAFWRYAKDDEFAEGTMARWLIDKLTQPGLRVNIREVDTYQCDD